MKSTGRPLLPRPHCIMPFFVDPFLLFLILARQLTAQSASDASRLGSSYTALTLYRGSATNILVVGVGTPPQDVNLTVCGHVLHSALVSADERQRRTWISSWWLRTLVMVVPMMPPSTSSCHNSDTADQVYRYSSADSSSLTVSSCLCIPWHC